MMEKAREWLSQRAGKRPVSLLFLLGLGGMLLILLSDFQKSPDDAGGQAPAAAPQSLTESEYLCQLEEKLAEMIRQVDGAGETAVMITLDSSRETVYAQNKKEEGESGGYETTHVLRSAANGEEPLVEMTWEPEIRGVAVVCQGGANVSVAARVTELVSVVLGVPSNRISIAKMT